MKLKSILLATIIFVSTNAFAKDQISLSKIGYDSSVVSRWLDNQETKISEIYQIKGDDKSIFINYGNAIAHHKGESITLLVPEYQNSLLIDSLTGDVILRSKGQQAKTVGKIDGSIDDKSGTIQLEKSITARISFVESYWYRECTAKLIDVCIAHGLPKKGKRYKFELLENGKLLFPSK